jgi:hypothetical protein
MSRWQMRLDNARAFYDGLVKEKLPGAAEVSDLIKELENAYELESWELKDNFPYGNKGKVRRVNPAKVRWSKLPPSPLRQEVQPEEVVLPVIAELAYDNDEEDWVRSTDPLHPIDTNYELLCAGIDDDLLDSLTEEREENENADSRGSDPFSVNWDWNDGVTGSTDGLEPHDPSLNSA